MNPAEDTSAEAARAPALDIQGRMATIRLRNPRHANRLSPYDLEVLRRHIGTVNFHEDVLVLRILADGKYFCSGYDMGALAVADAPSTLIFGETMDMLEAARPATIAGINGGAYGGGTDLCLACDFRIGVPQADMFMPAARLGLHFYPGGMARYVSRLGLDQARRLFLTGERIQADEMLRIGFLTELVQSEYLEQRLDALSEQLAGMAPLALLGMKKHLNLMARGRIPHEEIAQAVLRTEASSDLLEGTLAWKEKRPPRFTGS